MPNVDDAINYSNSDGSALRPERGWTYETGLKLKRGQVPGSSRCIIWI